MDGMSFKKTQLLGMLMMDNTWMFINSSSFASFLV